MSLNNKEIAKRYFSLFAVKNQTKLADALGITPSAVSDWKNGRRAVPWEKLTQVVEEMGVTWDWLLAGRGEPLALGELREDPNFNRKLSNVLIDKGVTTGITYSEKGEMTDSDGVEFLKDHLATLKQDKADLQAKVSLLEKEVADLREENKRLLTLSSVRDTLQAGSG